MAENDLHACQPRAYRTTTIRDQDAQPAIGDHVQRDFTAQRPGCKLVGDITYIRTWEGWLYLATVIDCHTRGVLGWSMAEHMRTDLVADAITMAAGNVALDPDAVFHSDSKYVRCQVFTEWPDPHSDRPLGLPWCRRCSRSFLTRTPIDP